MPNYECADVRVGLFTVQHYVCVIVCREGKENGRVHIRNALATCHTLRQY